MNREMLEGNWKQLKGRAKQKWGELTDDDLERAAGRRTELIGVIQKRYGKVKEQAEREVDGWIASLDQPTADSTAR